MRRLLSLALVSFLFVSVQAGCRTCQQCQSCGPCATTAAVESRSVGNAVANCPSDVCPLAENGINEAVTAIKPLPPIPDAEVD